MTPADRVLELLAASDGAAIVLDGPRADRIVLAGAWRIALARRTLHALADAGTVTWEHALVRDPTTTAACDDACTGNEPGHGPPADERHCCPGHLHRHRCRLAPCP